jgi:hypothetical protein
MAGKRPALLAGERGEHETDRAVQACNDYLRLGPGRSLPKLLKKLGKTRKNSESPTDSYNTLERWSSDYGWPARASAYDADLEAVKNEKRRQVMEQGLALDHERVVKLKRLARFLEEQIFAEGKADKSDVMDGADGVDGGHTYPNVWLADVKQIGSGESAERVDLVRFNASILAEYRAALADLAAETGGRRQRVDHAVANIDYGKLSDDQLQRIVAGEDPIQVIISGYIAQGQGQS